MARRGIYDNMPTAVDAVFAGKERRFNRRFLRMCSHYLVEPVACTPAAGWEKGQVENQVGNAREHLLTPRLHFADYAELDAWLEARCLAQARASMPAASAAARRPEPVLGPAEGRTRGIPGTTCRCSPGSPAR